MAKKLTQEEVIQQFIKVHGNRYSYVKYIHVNSHTKGIIICRDHGEFLQTTLDHKNKHGCPKCGKTGKLTQEEVIQQFIDVHGDRYSYIKFIYINSNTKGIIICPEHGEFLQSTRNHKRGQGCPKCANNKIPANKLTTEEIIQQFIEVHGNKYSYVKYIHTNSYKKGIIICPKHGEFLQTQNAHKGGAGCPKCGNIKKGISRKLETDATIRQFNAVHSNKFDYRFIEEDYETTRNKLRIICPNHGIFLQSPMVHKNGAGCPNCNINKKEEFLLSIFREQNIKTIYNDRDLIKPLEIDVLIPDYNFGIEHNGLVYHSYGVSNWEGLNNYIKLNKQKHLIKTKLMEEKGLQLFHIREDHLTNPIKKDIWKSMILNKCGISYKRNARKLTVVNLEAHQDFIKKFLEENHLQGWCPAKIKLGLQDPQTGIIYSIMTFGKSRFNKTIEWELLRFCNIKYHNVRGAASKLLKAFERVYKPISIISYANRDWSQGNLYKTLGFEFSHSSEPNYIYTNIKMEIISRQQVQKHKLKAFLESKKQEFDENLSERDNMINNGYRIYYDTGNLVYHKIYKRI